MRGLRLWGVSPCSLAPCPSRPRGPRWPALKPTHPTPIAADWVRDVAWAPNFGLPMNTVASAGQDGKVLVWTERQEGELAGCCCIACTRLGW